MVGLGLELALVLALVLALEPALELDSELDFGSADSLEPEKSSASRQQTQFQATPSQHDYKCSYLNSASNYKTKKQSYQY